MSTTPIDTWAVDLADVTYIYPFVGSEGIMAAVAIILWLLWHVWQVRHENATYKEEMEKHGSAENVKQNVGAD